MIAIYGNVFKIIFICLMTGCILSIILFLPHSLIRCHVLDGEHAGSEQDDDDNEGECDLESDPDHLRLNDTIEPENREQSGHPKQFHVCVFNYLFVCYYVEGDERGRDQRQICHEALDAENVDDPVFRDEEVYQPVR